MTYAIFSSDDNPMYKDFEPFVSRAWRSMGINPMFISVNNESEFYSEKVPAGNMAQIVRVLVPALFPDDIFITSDIDMLPISDRYFNEAVGLIKNDDDIINLTSDAYPPEQMYYPICYWISKGRNFSKITGIRDSRDVVEAAESWFSEGYGWTTDEKVFSRLVNQCHREKKVNFIPVVGRSVNGRISHRIDRSNWNYSHELLKQREYIDSHMLRPLSENFNYLKPLFEVVGAIK